MSNVLDTFQNTIAHHSRDVFGDWVGVVGCGGITVNVIIELFSRRIVKRYGCFPQQCSIPRNLSTKTKKTRALQFVGMDVLLPVAFQRR